MKNIFNNVPARKKFLKSENYEYRKILALFKTFALSNYKINMRLINNEKIVYNLESEKLLDRIESIYGKNVKEATIPISYKKDSYQINGFIGNLSLVKSTRNYQYLFINGRQIKNQLINTSIN